MSHSLKNGPPVSEPFKLWLTEQLETFREGEDKGAPLPCLFPRNPRRDRFPLKSFSFPPPNPVWKCYYRRLELLLPFFGTLLFSC